MFTFYLEHFLLNIFILLNFEHFMNLLYMLNKDKGELSVFIYSLLFFLFFYVAVTYAEWLSHTLL